MNAGFARVDITPRVGVELQGYGPFLNRHSDGIRDRLHARAAAFEVDGERAVLISCDLIGVSPVIAATVRELITEQTGIAGEQVLLHAIHTHSGPALRMYSGWGTPDPPYMELLPYRLAQAAAEAVADRAPMTLHHAEVPCKGIAINREYDAFQAESVDAALAEEWQPLKPECVDSTCHVLVWKSQAGAVRAFASYYGCHPVLGGSTCRKIHGDYAGIATNLVERLHPGVNGMFLQGAQGDVNSCLVCKSEGDALRALDIVGARYARAILAGIEAAEPLDVDRLAAVVRPTRFSRKPWGRAELEKLAAEQEAIIHRPDADDADGEVRMAMVRLIAARKMLARLDAGEDLSPPVPLHGLRLGPVAFLGSPFEVFRAIKQDVVASAQAPIPLVMGFVDDSIGYAPDRTAAARGGYAADVVPLICGQLPYANIHDELVAALNALDADLAP